MVSGKDIAGAGPAGAGSVRLMSGLPSLFSGGVGGESPSPAMAAVENAKERIGEIVTIYIDKVITEKLVHGKIVGN